MKTTREQLIKKYWRDKKVSLSDIGKLCGCDESNIRRIAKNMGLPARSTVVRATSIPERLVEDRKIEAHKREDASMKALYKEALKQLDMSEQKLAVYERTRNIDFYTIKTSPSGAGHSATAVILASDWHWAEKVTLDATNGLNEFNPTIRIKRAEAFFSNAARLVKGCQRDIRIKEVILALLGDFISGQLHPELSESNYDLLMEELISVQKVLASGIRYLLQETNCNLIIPCHSGNHGRVTKKVQGSTEHGNSLEYMMYHNLAVLFENEPRVKFIIPKSYLSYILVGGGFTLRLHHGHSVRTQGGIGGIYPPMYKAVLGWNQSRHANLTVCGHFHTVREGGSFLINGSLVGYNDFAIRQVKAAFEPPKQMFFLIDHQRKEKTTTCPIFLE